MNNIIRFWNINRKQIIIVGLIVVFLIIIVQILNQIEKNKKEESAKLNTTVSITQEENLPTESIISGKTVSEELTRKNNEIIEEFIEDCNNAKVEEAYNLLTDKCKELIFPTQEIFKTNYYDVIFSENRIYNIKNWISESKSNTYLIEYYNDVMSTGRVEEEIAFQDYITISDEDNGKININGYIKGKDINSSNENDEIKVTVIDKQCYKEYEEYKVEVQNKTDNTILLDTRNKSGTIYLVDDDNIKYSANLTFLSNIETIIGSNQTVTYKLRFMRVYDSSVVIKSMNFRDIVDDYTKYQENAQNYDGRISITVEM